MYTDPTGYKFEWVTKDANVEYGQILGDLSPYSNQKGIFSGATYMTDSWWNCNPRNHSLEKTLWMLENWDIVKKQMVQAADRFSNPVCYWTGDPPQSTGDGIISNAVNIIKNLWDNPFVRVRTGDAIFINTTFSLVFLGGGSNATGFVLPLHGPNSFELHFINTASLRFGAQGGWDVSAGKVWFNGPANLAYVREMDGGGYSFDLNLGLVLGWGPGAGVFESHKDEGKTTWGGGFVSFGYGIGGSFGFDHTYTTPVFKK